MKIGNHRTTSLVLFILFVCIYLLIRTNEKISKEEEEEEDGNRYLSICPQLSSSSKGYLRVEIVTRNGINHSSICQSTDELLIYILSTYKNWQRRDAIRKTWANKKLHSKLNRICFVFVVGLSTTSNDSLLVNLTNESTRWNDIVQLNIEETYGNVVYKEVGALKWTHSFASHIPFLFKTDDDLVVDTLLLNDIIQFLLTNQTHHSRYLQKKATLKPMIEQMQSFDRYTLFRGKLFDSTKTFRRGKFRIHELAWNYHRLPPYCSGFGLLFSSFIRDRLYRASLCYGSEYVPLVGDVFMSGFLAGAASVRCSSWPLNYVQTGEPCSRFFDKYPRLIVCSTSLHYGKNNFLDFDSAWKAIVQRHFI